MNKNMKKTKRWQSLAVLTFLLLFGYASWKIVFFFISSLIKADPKVSASIIGAMATVSGAIAAVLITQRQSKQREIAEAHREKKVEIYREFLLTVQGVLANINEKVSIKGPTEQELIDFMVNFKTNLILWGSPKVITAHLEFEAVTASGGDVLSGVNKLYQAIREDIGLSNKGLNNLELIKLYLKDPKELDELKSSNKKINLIR